MRVGIHCRYGRHDATYAVLQVARVALEAGHDVSILSVDKPSAVHPVWDRRVVRGRVSLREWLRGEPDYIVCAGPAPADDILSARKEGTRCYRVCLWDELDPQDVACLPAFDRVVFPSRRAFRLVGSRVEAANLSWSPWDVGVPVTRNPYDLDPSRVGVIWNLDSPRHEEPSRFLGVVETALRKCPGVFFTVVYSDLPAAGQRELKRLVQVGDGRLEVAKGLAWDRQQYLYGRHDLTVWPALADGLGLVGLSSLYMGTPVVAWDHPVAGEIVRDRVNGVLVPCDLESNWLSVPRVQPDYRGFARFLVDLLRDLKQLEALRHGTAAGLVARRDHFRTFWTNLLEQ